MAKKLLILPVFALIFLSFPRLSRAQEPSTTYYFFPNYEETDGLPTKYYSLAGGAMAVRRGSELFFLHQDHLSSTRSVTSDQGTVISRFDYFPYGQSINNQLTIN